MISTFLYPQVIALLFGEVITILLCVAPLIFGIQIYKFWNFESLESSQYILEKKNYLSAVVIRYILYLQLIIFLVFVYTIDDLHNVLQGAMCGAGVIASSSFGMVALCVKLVVIFLSLCWLIVDKLDMANAYGFIFKKTQLFFILFGLFILGAILEILFFAAIPLGGLVSCCSAIYAIENFNTISFFTPVAFFVFFGLLTSLFLTALLFQNRVFSALLGICFLYFGYYFIIHVAGIYVYQLPTHICPFCMLQKEYYFIGYIIWGLFFGGAFFAIAPSIIYFCTQKNFVTAYRISLWLIIGLFCLSFGYIGFYYFNNGVFL